MARDRRHWLSSERGEKWRTSLSRRNHFEITGGEGYQRYGVVMVRERDIRVGNEGELRHSMPMRERESRINNI